MNKIIYSQEVIEFYIGKIDTLELQGNSQFKFMLERGMKVTTPEILSDYCDKPFYHLQVHADFTANTLTVLPF